MLAGVEVVGTNRGGSLTELGGSSGRGGGGGGEGGLDIGGEGYVGSSDSSNELDLRFRALRGTDQSQDCCVDKANVGSGPPMLISSLKISKKFSVVPSWFSTLVKAACPLNPESV